MKDTAKIQSESTKWDTDQLGRDAEFVRQS